MHVLGLHLIVFARHTAALFMYAMCVMILSYTCSWKCPWIPHYMIAKDITKCMCVCVCVFARLLQKHVRLHTIYAL
jgi:hypothetical protein